jgi:tetrahydromethanopterin S-methyltransferase subunit H
MSLNGKQKLQKRKKSSLTTGMKEIKVNNIILRPFIDMLMEAYNSGADYIDLIAQQKGDNQDTLGVHIRSEYMDMERHSKWLKEKSKKKDERMTIETLNQLLNNSIN